MGIAMLNLKCRPHREEYDIPLALGNILFIARIILRIALLSSPAIAYLLLHLDA